MMQHGPLPHARLLSADRRGRERRDDAARDHPGDAADDDLRAAGPRDRPRRRRRRWRRRSRRAISDGARQSRPSIAIARTSTPISHAHQHKSLLRFITCGIVDDGKSTLIGRLLYDSKMIFEDQLAALESRLARSVGTQGEEIDFALLVDGLAAEREQGITIDVAYRFFSTDKRKFIVADTPGHEQYTRNMATGASTADLAVILIDARKGVLHADPAAHAIIVLAAGHPARRAGGQQDGPGRLSSRTRSTRSSRTTARSPQQHRHRRRSPRSRCRRCNGDNIIARQRATCPGTTARRCWRYLETVEVERRARSAGRSACRCSGSTGPNLDFRGFAGTIVERHGASRATRSRVLPSGKTSTVTRIVTLDGDLDEAVAGQAVTLTLADEIDVARRRASRAADDAAAGGRPVRGDASSGWPTRRCCPAAPTG